MRKLVVMVAAAAMLSGPMVAATPPTETLAQHQTGLVNVNIGDVTVLRNVAVGVAVAAIVNACGNHVNAAAILAAIQQNGQFTSTCTATGQPITVTPSAGP